MRFLQAVGVMLRVSVAILGFRRKNDRDMCSVSYNLFNPQIRVIATRMCIALSLVQQSLDGICANTTSPFSR